MNHDANPTTNSTPTGPTDRVYGLPIATPLDREPAADRVEAAEMWRVALAHVGIIGGWDRKIAAWLAHWDAGTVATVASLLRRAWAAGVTAGRREALDEADDLQVLACDVDRLTDHADIQRTAGEADAQEVLEELLDSLRMRVSADVPHAEVLERVAVRSRRRYHAALAGGLEPAQRLLAMSVAVDTARTTLLADSELAAAVRAIIDADRELDDAVAEVTDPPACGGCETPLCPTRPGELCPRSKVDMARVDQVHGYGADADDADGGHVSVGLVVAVASVVIVLTSAVAWLTGHSEIAVYGGAAGAVLGVWVVRHGARDGGAS